MTAYVARVRNGRLILDVPTALPEGTEVALVTDADDLADLPPAERERLEDDLRAGLRDERAGVFEDGDELLRQLRSR